MTLFEAAVNSVLKHEGGLVDHPDDPGGLTNMGISLRAHPHLGRAGIINMRREDAIEIYRRDYWAWIPDGLPNASAWFTFDTAVNSGVARARAFLREDESLTGLVSQRLAFLVTLPTWSTFGRGWSRRIAGVLADIGAWEKGEAGEGGGGQFGYVSKVVLHRFPLALRWAVLASARPDGTALLGEFKWRVRPGKLDVDRIA